MLERRTVELMEGLASEALTADEYKDARQILATNAEARALYEQHLALIADLNELPLASPPADLKGRILQSIQAKPHSQPSRRRWQEYFPGFVSARSALRYSLTFAGGAIAGVLLFVLSQRPGEHDLINGHEGTVLPSEPAQEYVAVPIVRFGGAGEFGGMQLLRSDDYLIASVTLKDKKGRPIMCDISSIGAIPLDCRQLSGGQANILKGDRSLTIQATGSTECVIFFRRDSQNETRLQVKVRIEAEVVFEGPVSSSPPNSF